MLSVDGKGNAVLIKALNVAYEEYLSESHRIVSKGLIKKKQKELGLNQN